MKLEVKVSQGGKLPTFAHLGDAGMDLYNGNGDCHIAPGERRAVHTNIKVAIPDNHVGLIMDKSGLALTSGLSVMGGVIDSGYRGFLQVILLNASNEHVYLSASQKIAQLLILPVVQPEVVWVDELSEAQDSRGEGGFGSTGV